MKVRLIRLLGGFALALLLTSVIFSCKTQVQGKKYTSNDRVSEVPPPPPPQKPSSSVTTTSVPQGNNAAKNNSSPKWDYRNAEDKSPKPYAPQNQVSTEDVKEIPKPVMMEEETEVVEDAMGDFDIRSDDFATDPPRQVTDAQRKEEEKGRLNNELKDIQSKMREMEDQAREREELAKIKMQEETRKSREAEQARLAKAESERKRIEEERARLANQPIEPVGREDYAHIDENDFTSPLSEPLSTFSIDVDKAAYANTRRYLNSGSLPPAGAVRIEELINYFLYDYRQPFSSQPFAFHTEASSCPWNSDHQLVHIGLKGRVIDRSEMPASNLVFLIDVSGSMNNANKLPLLKKAFNMLVDNLNGEDRVAIVVYAGAAGVVLPSTPASQKSTIMNALNQLSAGGSTAGGAGIQLAYQIARNHMIKGGNNRVILATDGDFNVGPSSESALIELIESKRKEGVFLSVLGFGTGNYQDRRMEQIADHGNGNYAYIDNLQEAQKVLVQEMGGTLHAIAKDVKIQIEFNPTYVKAYRLIGYENRALAAQDFNDDTKDAGELGAGHTVTALYEIVPHSANTPVAGIDPLKYQQLTPSNLSTGAELMTLKFRYKEPDGDESKLLTEVVKTTDKTLSATSDNFRFAASVAAFGMLLRGSRYSGDADYDMVYDMASKARGRDENGYRKEFLQLVQRAKAIDNRGAVTGN